MNPGPTFILTLTPLAGGSATPQLSGYCYLGVFRAVIAGYLKTPAGAGMANQRIEIWWYSKKSADWYYYSYTTTESNGYYRWDKTLYPGTGSPMVVYNGGTYNGVVYDYVDVLPKATGIIPVG